ncbi:DUF6264 family protein [Microbacterium sp. Root180]|uniref:DUF6264 family protein n=1 Tax=Microbacterium sp. Root180 TaxID=1736483 RepID=UPI0006FF0F6A|nr:DUF6264 family protein [Microbacterium sp. Root180]KRB39085.1 hypothetical protein ASD93_03980 [Microbacterium sp. Root180]
MTATPDPRPRPQYGEYATPEEQRARIAQPDIGQVYEPAPVLDEPVAPAPAVQPVATPAEAGTRRSRPIDRIVTFALLAYGLVTVISSFPALIDYASYAETMFGILGVDAELSDPAAGRPWGIAAAFVLAVGWLVTAALSWMSLRRGRISWWIPLVGGVVFTFVSATLMLVPLMNDPAVWDALVSSIR